MSMGHIHFVEFFSFFFALILIEQVAYTVARCIE